MSVDGVGGWCFLFELLSVEHFHFGTHCMALSTAMGLSNLQDHLSLVCNRPRACDVPLLSKPLCAQATNCVRYSAENNDLLEFLGDRLVNLITR